MYLDWESRQAMADTKSSGVSSAPEPNEDEDDIRARFAAMEASARQVPTPSDLPEPPSRTFTRPTLHEFAPGGRDGKIGKLSVKNVGGAGLASSTGIMIFASVVMGVGLGAAADYFLLGRPQTPWGLITGFFVGLLLAGMQLVRLLKQIGGQK